MEPTTSQLMAIPNGKAGTKATLKLMGQLVAQYKTALPIRQLAMRLARPNGQKNFLGEVRNLHAFVRDRIRYIKDVRGVETLQTPVKTLEFGQGDCDDKSMLLAALLESIGHPSRFIAVGRNGQYQHVLVQTKIGLKWISLESTEPVPMGWHPRGMNTKPMLWHN